MRHFLSALVVIAIVAPTLPAQQPGDRFSLLTCGLLYLDDPTFRREVDLKPEQLTALKAQRGKLYDAYGKCVLFNVLERGPDWCADATRAIGQTLSDKQALRWRQLVLQDFTRRFGAYRTVRMTEVQSALKLESEQVARLEKGEEVNAVLTADQRRKWQELRGPGPAQALTLTLPPPLIPAWPRSPESDHLVALAMPAVHQELGIDEEQRTKLGELRQKWLRGRQEMQRLPPDRQPAFGKELLVNTGKGVAEILTKAQQTRLDQITRQLRLPRGIPPAVVPFLDGPTRTALLLTADQEARLNKVLAERGQWLAQAAEKGATVAEVVQGLEEGNVRASKALAAVLDAAQKQKLGERFGKPFLGQRVAVNAETLFAVQSLPLYLQVLPYFQQDSLATELALTKEQQVELAKLEESLSESVVAATSALSPKERDQKRAEAYNTTLKSLQKILNAQQQTRLRELTLQCLELSPEGPPDFRAEGLARWPEMVKELGLTEKQVAQLGDAPHVKAVLTAEQWQKWQQLRGKPWPFFQTIRVEDVAIPLPARLDYLEVPAIRAELKMNQDQQVQLDAALEGWRELALRSTAWTPQERKEKFPALTKKIHDELFAFLTPEQGARLAQIGRQQWLKEEGLSGLFEIAGTEAALKLSAEQQAKLQELRHDRALIDRLVRQQRLSATNGNNVELWARIHSADRARLEKLLTEDQNKQLNALFGAPFVGQVPTHAINAQGAEDLEIRLFGFVPPR